jgi:hypothetical protein
VTVISALTFHFDCINLWHVTATHMTFCALTYHIHSYKVCMIHFGALERTNIQIRLNSENVC